MFTIPTCTAQARIPSSTTTPDDYVSDRFSPTPSEQLEELQHNRPDLLIKHKRQVEQIIPEIPTNPTIRLANRSPGCKSFAPAHKSVCGEILNHYQAIGAERSWLGPPISDELTNPDKSGKRSEFINGFIYLVHCQPF
ncbi:MULTISPECIES: LGFP repeat-containing protein [Corynebacterium]|uniref:Uncharacterized protein n=2 Tax=Corynebacterium glucuronolyticum TaxID=39791 RepID=A0AAX1L7S2_9CORY|nr:MULTISPECIES: hypothetical protein [Corynebacterium]EEI64197.1 hypothetical protein HMPREF0293_0284 [Corynebacterium glucuronolyticum ATCC 51866]QRP70253.1 hypothetical protein I6J21_10885 [Corynebacterium glucuronolyticum]